MGEFNIGMWNIIGLSSNTEHKLDYPEVIDFLSSNEISCLVESHSDADSNVLLKLLYYSGFAEIKKRMGCSLLLINNVFLYYWGPILTIVVAREC